MYRYLAVVVSFLFYASCASANYEGRLCKYTDISASTEIFADLVVAPIGSQVGALTITVVTSGCNPSSGKNSYFVNTVQLGPQPSVPGKSSWCQTSVEGIALDVGSDACMRGAFEAGPSIGGFVAKDKPMSITRTFPYVKTGAVAPGVKFLAPYVSKLSETVEGEIGKAGTFDISGYKIPSGKLVSSSCTLVDSSVLVDFGSVSSVGVEKPFTLEFGNCATQAEASAYNSAISLRFRSERISPDGAALRNNNCANCSQGLQIALKDGAGTAMDLSKSYRLASNSTVDIGRKGLRYHFSAQLQDVPGYKASPGIIDAQLIFETVIE